MERVLPTPLIDSVGIVTRSRAKNSKKSLYLLHHVVNLLGCPILIFYHRFSYWVQAKLTSSFLMSRAFYSP